MNLKQVIPCLALADLLRCYQCNPGYFKNTELGSECVACRDASSCAQVKSNCTGLVNLQCLACPPGKSGNLCDQVRCGCI